MENKKEISTDTFKTVIDKIVTKYKDELIAISKEELEEGFYFRWDDQISLEHNFYEFTESLELFKSRCEDWERHHNGSICLVERVRDIYLMPKIKNFMAEMKTKLNAN